MINQIKSLCVFAVVLLSVTTVNKGFAFQDITINKADIVKGVQLKNSKDFTNFKFETDGKVYRFVLHDNSKVLLGAKRMLRNSEVQVFAGKIEGIDNSWARFVQSKGVMKGAFYDGAELYLLEGMDKVYPNLAVRSLRSKSLSMKSNSNGSLALIKASDVSHTGTCGMDSAMHTHDHSTMQQGFNFDSYVQDLAVMTASASSEVVINITADTEFVSAAGDELAEILQSVNFADGIFSEQLGVSIRVDDIELLTDNDGLTSRDPITLLNSLRQTAQPNPGLKHLFTGKDLNGSTVGIAYVGALCSSFSLGVTQRFGSLTELIFTHELGHNFGAPHDGESGSACQSESSGFVMWPNINGAGPSFSECSISQMEPVIQNGTSGFNACVVPITTQPPAITSQPNTSADVGIAYQYDADNTVDVNSESPVTFSLDIAPEGMTLNEDGLIEWTPKNDQTGTNPVQITVSNQDGNDTQFFEVFVSSDFLNLNEYGVESYGGSQDQTGNTEIIEDGFGISLDGNNWKSIPLRYEVTTSTVLEFEFKSDNQGEIHGIGFDLDKKISSGFSFSVYGSQPWGRRSYRYTGDGEFVKFTIPVGQFYVGGFNHLFFMVDNDRTPIGSNSVFKNIRIYEEEASTPEESALDLSVQSIVPFNEAQDQNGLIELTDAGYGITISGNTWQKISLPRDVNSQTVIRFDFKMNVLGEIQGLGIFSGSNVNAKRAFKLTGTQEWGITDFEYNGNGEYQTFVIPVGQYFLADNLDLILINDHDVANPNASISIKNIVIYDAQ